MNKSLGQVMTPFSLANKMLSLRKNNGTILDPSSGTGIFLDLISECHGIEIDENIVLEKHKSRVNVGNFIEFDEIIKFDSIIGNPPYVCTKGHVQGKLITHRVKNDQKSTYLPMSANLYLRFIEKAIQCLNDDGELIFVVPIEFFHRTSGKNLRLTMLEHGSFSDVWFESAYTNDWSAAVEVCVFRWQKNLRYNKCSVDFVEKNVVERNGCVFFTGFKPTAFLDEFFTATVGERPRKSDMSLEFKPNAIKFAAVGKTYWIDISNRNNWPRKRNPISGNKILFDEGPTRRKIVFESSSSDRFVSCALIPRDQALDIEKWTSFLNEYDRWEELTLRVGGRWRVGANLLNSTPLSEMPL